MLKRTRLSLAISAAFGAGLMGTAPVAEAQQQLDRVEITGSSIRRVDAETALPVTIIQVEDLIKQGVTTAEQALQRIAANQSTQGISASIGDTSGGASYADLRGLSAATGTDANKTLVLLNGRRMVNHPFDAASVDLNAIPLAAISRIEVLRDGASAVYGTDAIGGVINFILRRDFQGIDIAAEYQLPQESSAGQIKRVTLAAGFGSLAKQGFNVMGSFDWREQKVMLATDREFARTGILGPSRADLTAGTSGTSFPGDANGFEPSGPACNPPSSLPRFTNPDNSGAFNSCRFDFTREIDIIPQNEQKTWLLRGSLGLGSARNHVLSAEYVRAENEGTQRVAPSPVNQFIPATSPFFPVGAPVTNVPGFGAGAVANWRQVPAGKRTSHDETTTDRLLFDLTGAIVGWDYRFGVGRSESESVASVSRGYLSDSIVQAGVIAGTVNPFGPQTAAGQAVLDAATIRSDTVIGNAKVDFIDARITKDLFQMPAGPLAMALGGEYRKERSSYEATAINSELINTLGIDPDSDVSGDRKVKAVFTEFAIPIMRNLDLTLAGRYDDYSDFGNTFNPKVGLRFQPIKQVLLRGSYNTGFRAPTLYEIFEPQSLTFTSDNYDDPLLCPGGTAVPGAAPGVVCGQQVLQRESGPASIGLPASALNPEDSKTYSFGVVFEPTPQWTFGIDYWNIKIENLISAYPEQAVFGNPAANASRFFRCSQLAPGPGPGIDRSDIDVCLNFPTFDPIAFIDTPNANLGDLETDGVDISIGWRSTATSYGRWGITLDGTYVRKYRYQREQGGDFIDAAGDYTDNAPVFRWQHVLALNWSAGPWSAVIANRYKSGYKDQGGANDVRHYSVFDTSVTWQGLRGLTLTVGVLNVGNEDPPRSVQSTTFQRGYDPRFTDPRGRTWLFRAGYNYNFL